MGNRFSVQIRPAVCDVLLLTKALWLGKRKGWMMDLVDRKGKTKSRPQISRRNQKEISNNDD
jgi:hypothetical protein